MARYFGPEWYNSTEFDECRVGNNTFDCDLDEVPAVAVTLAQYKEIGGVPLRRGRRVADAEYTEHLYLDGEARTRGQPSSPEE